MNQRQTNRIVLQRRLCMAFIVFVVCACRTPLRAQSIAEIDKAGVVTVQENGQTLLEYRSLPNPMKVYLSKWFTPQGTQVLRDSPSDHVHHHALMYALGIDDCDFWSEVPAKNYGKQVPASEASVMASSSGDHCQVVIKQAINWVNTQDQVLAVEAREITALRGEVQAASLLTWSTTLTPTEAKPEVELWGSHYFGLGMRFVESMDKDVTFVTPGNETGTVVRGSEKLTRATWCALRAKADGKPVTIAMFDAPSNPRHPATWFTMTAFTYLSATLDLAKEKMTISRDHPLQVKYGVAAWDGEVDKAEIERVYQVWLKLP
ncbi:MAG: DUF6807 family protein [Pirellulaceae bacterium]